ncbi:PHP domain-containing protein [Acaricomes phytoseiuli]|uniref:PHP domain-containing protein n=1 Tax=Acaricomes phytoseiuli TaxID=291968 RepID=UPI00037A7651|nr:PHP domain-containing protein [Acaricomes phytoseiuli]MCW1249040.1 PHP domain-containing protein [Acaricomes phytoseiuli]
MRIDLHTHSTVSDGTEAPSELIRSARAAGLDVVALTDHDSTAGWQEAATAARAEGIALVPGMEVSSQTPEGITVHVLSYLHNPEHPGLLAEVQKSRQARLGRAEQMATLIAEDYPISWEDVSARVAPGATVGRPHIADALVVASVVRTRDEAFESILSARGKYWVSHYAPEPAVAVALIRSAGGVPVFAHPVAVERGRVVGDEVYRQMIDAGLAGLEIEHRDNPAAGKEFLYRLAAEHDLIVTGSSDYHGAGKRNRLGENTTSPQALARIEDLASGTDVVR